MSDTDEFRVDPHVKVLDEQVCRRARNAGLDAIVYAPHFTRLPEIRARAEAYSSPELRVIPAREIFTGSWQDRKHVLAIGLSDPIPDFISLEAAMAELDRQGAAVLAPHPEFATVSLTEADLREHRDVVDTVEVFNPKHLPTHNHRARTLAEDLDRPPFASSYAHLPDSVGVAYTAFEEPLEDEADLVAALADGVARRAVYRNGFRRWRTTAAELAHLCWENSWQKIDRLFLQGIEPTHPDHIAYDGKFDDAAVY
ncbi:PHP-associated domain-containing protein [Natrialbaceae archaeon AArc-T1-2]|uniref:PHP-associated domain-containing protein n=1 Tax=Natrialbaceae archaeon AArc-T1-2 TaxID=3053904 RepID=UPI00255B22E3|nr:PHP-associated domain-containing protein [Natrialbaceae archaeon AArc-T1-2]WIV66778.1 PHP-associated domain-containing protein [Natrialbaceae archaeon AArc-T1-2]